MWTKPVYENSLMCTYFWELCKAAEFGFNGRWIEDRTDEKNKFIYRGDPGIIPEFSLPLIVSSIVLNNWVVPLQVPFYLFMHFIACWVEQLDRFITIQLYSQLYDEHRIPINAGRFKHFRKL